MPSLYNLLKHTMLFKARGWPDNWHLYDVCRNTSFQTNASPYSEPTYPSPLPEDTSRMNIWHWRIGQSPNVIRDVTCLARGVGGQRMTVFEYLKFHDPKITNVSGHQVSLPLNQNFLVGYYYDQGQTLDGNDDVFRLPASLDQSLVHAFAFDFRNGWQQPPQKSSPTDCANDNFMPELSEVVENIVEHTTASIGSRHDIVIDTPRVIVFVSLICCHEKADFEPGEALAAARIIPHVMIMSNVDLAVVKADIEQRRPRTSTLAQQQTQHHNHHSNHQIASGLFSDRNERSPLLRFDDPVFSALPLYQGIPVGIAAQLAPIPSPVWGDLFDFYKTEVNSGEFSCVDNQKPERRISQAKAKLNVTRYELQDVDRVRRQGAFDNIHVAPTMRLPDLDERTYLTGKISMAPVCEHDCLHTHWRWGTFNTNLGALGWSDTPNGWLPTRSNRVPGHPSSTRGSPMVPDNQSIRLEVVSPHGFAYKATALGASRLEPSRPIPAGSFTIINHHGSAYSIALNGVRGRAALTLVCAYLDYRRLRDFEPLLSWSCLSSPYALMYWRLRYGGRGESVMERLRFVDETALLDN